MAGKKPIIDIDLDPQGKFKNFVGLFEKYQTAVKGLPEGWKAVANEANASVGEAERMLALMLTQNHLARDTARAEIDAANASERERKQREQAERSGVLHWRDIARSTRDFAGNILAATASLLKWTTVTTAVSGLLGAGGLFGIDRLASSVASGRQTARGQGVSYGESKAFGINFGQLVDPDSLLGSVSQDRANFGINLSRLGLSNAERSGSNADVSVALLNRFKQFVDHANPNTLAVQMQQQGWSQFFSNRDANTIKATPLAELAADTSKYRTDAAQLNLPNSTQDVWAKFVQQMQRAGDKIENIAAGFLKRFEGPLESLSRSFVTLVNNLANSPVIAGYMDTLAKGLEKFAAYVGTAKFQQDAQDLVKWVGESAKEFGKLARALSWIIGREATTYGDVVPFYANAFAGTDNPVLPSVNIGGRSQGVHSPTAWDVLMGRDVFATPNGAGVYNNPALDNGSTDITRGISDFVKSIAAHYTSSAQSDTATTDSFAASLRTGAFQPEGAVSAGLLSKALQSSRTDINITNPAGANITTSTSQVSHQ